MQFYRLIRNIQNRKKLTPHWKVEQVYHITDRNQKRPIQQPELRRYTRKIEHYQMTVNAHRVQGVTRGSRFQRKGESFFYASATDGMWVTSFFIIVSIHLQKYIAHGKQR